MFAKWNSKKTITGEDDDEETELKFLTEIRNVRDKQPDLFERIKRLPKKARSTRSLAVASALTSVRGTERLRFRLNPSPRLLTYFRQGKLDKFFLGASGSHDS